jgi:hypothetical protein
LISENKENQCAKPYDKRNIIYQYKLVKGNTVEAFSKCDIIIGNNYETFMVDHAFL